MGRLPTETHNEGVRKMVWYLLCSRRDGIRKLQHNCAEQKQNVSCVTLQRLMKEIPDLHEVIGTSNLSFIVSTQNS